MFKQHILRTSREAQPYFHTDHRRPITRRELVGQGMIGGLAFCSAPTLIGLLGQYTPEAWAAAEACKAGGGAGGAAAGHVGFFSVEGSGGFKLACANFLVGVNNQTDTSTWTDAAFEKNGFNKQMQGYGDNMRVNAEYGVLMHENSRFLVGLNSKTSPECRANVNGGIITCISENDSGGQDISARALVGQLQNPMLQGHIGQRAGARAGRHNALGGSAATNAVQVTNDTQAGSFFEAGKAELIMGEGRQTALAAAEALTSLAAGKLAAEEATKTLLNCAFEVSKEQAANSDASVLMSRVDPQIAGPQGVFTIAELDGDDTSQATASMAKMVMGGYAGTATIEIGGCDYHNRGRATQDAKDEQIGEQVGALLEIAHRKQQKVFIQISSDGAVAARQDGAADGRYEHRNDNSATSIVVVMMYDPAGRPEAVNTQVGGMDSAGNSILTSPATGSLIGMGDAVLLNYAVHTFGTAGIGMFEQVAPNSPLGKGAGLEAFIHATPVA